MSITDAALVDQHGNPFTGDADAVELYDQALDRLLRYHPEVVETTFRLVGEYPDVPMAHALVAYLHLTSTDAPDLPEKWTSRMVKNSSPGMHGRPEPGRSVPQGCIVGP